MLITGLLIAGGVMYVSMSRFGSSNMQLQPLLRKKRRDRLVHHLMHSPNIDNDDIDDDATKRLIKHHLTLSLAALGLTSIGALAYAPLTLASLPLLGYIAFGFFHGGYESLFKERRVGMAVVDAIVLPGMLIAGYFFVSAVAYSFYYFGRTLSLKAKSRSEQSLVDIFGTLPHTVWFDNDGVEVEIPFDQLAVGDIVVVDAGGTVPVDGTIVAGNALIDQHILTGESQLQEKSTGDAVFASTLVLSGKIWIEVDKAVQDTVAAQINRLLLQTAEHKTSLQLRGERIADQSALPLLLLSTVTLPLLGLQSALAVLNAGFGYTMRVIAPLSTLNFLNIASRQGILIKDGRVLESLKNVDTIVFDKTGTLTLSQPKVANIYTCQMIDETTLLAYAAAAERRQTHPIAYAILDAAHQHGLDLPGIDEAEYEIGYGVKVCIEQKIVLVGSKRFIENEEIGIPKEINLLQNQCDENGHSLIYISINGQLAGAIELQPMIRPEAKESVAALSERGFDLCIISGDQETPLRTLAADLKIERFYANTLPQDKASLVKQMQEAGRFVCYIGDGINDAVALKQANISVSLRGASTIATDTAQIVLMDQSLSQLISLLDITQNFEKNMHTNFMLTLVPGVACIGGIFFLGFGIIPASILFNIGLSSGLVNAMLPLLKHQGQLFD